MAKYLKADGTEEEVLPADNKHFSLDELQAFVGGLIDIQTMPSGRKLVINDEGKLDGLPRNEAATKIWCEEYPIDQYPNNNDQLVVGDVLLVEKDSTELQ